MNWVHAGVWGILGGFVIEGLDLYGALRRHGCWPWRVRDTPGVHAGPLQYAVAEGVRLVIGGVLASAAAASGQVSGALAAVAIGVGAPIMVHRLTELIPLTASSTETTQPSSRARQSQSPLDMEPKSRQVTRRQRGG